MSKKVLLDAEIRTCKQKLFYLGSDHGNMPLPKAHFKAAGKIKHQDTVLQKYRGSAGFIDRGDVNQELYWPVYYVDPNVLIDEKTKSKPVWADEESDTTLCRFHEMTNLIDRRSHHGKYMLNPYIFKNDRFFWGKFPVNPVGKTGISGRGLLGRWGPNHAADPIVTKIDYGKIYFVSIQRTDNGQWALPGGMVEPGDNISKTLRKEFAEEVMRSDDMDTEEKKKLDAHLKELFRNAVEVYRGYVDDPRNTDNAWMETVAMHVHIDTESANKLKLDPGSDASSVEWKEFTQDIELYASHSDFIRKAIQNLVQQNAPGIPEWVRQKFSRRDD